MNMKNKYLQAVIATIIFFVGFFIFTKIFGVFQVDDGQTMRQALREHVVPLGISFVLALLTSLAVFYATTRSASQLEKDATAAMSLKLTSETSGAAEQILSDISHYQMPDQVERTAETYARAVKIALSELAKDPSIDKATELHDYAVSFAAGYRAYIQKAKIAEFDEGAKSEMKNFESKIPSLIDGLKNLIKSLGTSESLDSITMSLEMKMKSWGRLP